MALSVTNTNTLISAFIKKKLASVCHWCCRRHFNLLLKPQIGSFCWCHNLKVRFQAKETLLWSIEMEWKKRRNLLVSYHQRHIEYRADREKGDWKWLVRLLDVLQWSQFKSLTSWSFSFSLETRASVSFSSLSSRPRSATWLWGNKNETKI